MIQRSMSVVVFVFAALLSVGGYAGGKTAPAKALPATINATELQSELMGGHDLFLLDVRSSSEFSEGHIKGAKNIPILTLKNRLAEVPKDKDVVAICLSGGRSSRAVEILKSSGYTRVANFEGGMSTWKGPVEK